MYQMTKLDQPEILNVLFTQSSMSAEMSSTEGELIAIPVAEGISIHCFFKKAAEDAPTILYFGDCSDKPDTIENIARNYNRHGVNVFIVSYRGHGMNAGTPSLSTLIDDADSIYTYCRDWLISSGFTGPLFILGNGLGSVCAIEIAFSYGDMIKGLIVENCICDTVPFLEALGVSTATHKITEEDGLQLLAKIEKIKIPTLIFHGANDKTVPIPEAEKLQASSGARSKQFFIIPGARRDNLIEAGGELYYKTVKTHIDTVSGVNTWRQRRRRFKKGQGEQG